MTTDTPRTEALPSDLEGINNDLVIRALRIFGREKMTKDGSLESWIHLGADRLEKAEAEVERLRSTMRAFINFMDENLGTTADWPMEVAFDDEETCKRYCDHLNAMKRLVKPEDIN